MRFPAFVRFSACLLVLLSALPSVAAAADHAWTTGTWGPAGAAGTYAIETAAQVITARAEAGAAPIAATPGTAVQFAVEDRRVFVLDAQQTEHELALVDSRAKHTRAYSAIGGGHYITAVAPGGTQLTLEDRSVWDIDPRRQFAVSGWQVEDLISIRRSDEDPDFGFLLDNTTQDTATLANLRAR